MEQNQYKKLQETGNPEKKFSIKKAIIISATVFLILVLNETFLSHTSFRGNKEVEVSAGLGSRKIGDLLKSEGVIRSKWMFVIYATLRGEASNLKPGTYLFTNSDSIFTIERVLVGGGKNEVAVTIPEGWDTKDIAMYLEDKKIADQNTFENLAGNVLSQGYNDKYNFLHDRPNGASLEGYLFPDTYRIAKGTSPKDIIAALLSNFDKKVTPELRQSAVKKGHSLFEIITMASIIEDEVKSDSDRAIVSGILWKRIKEGMPLQVDATLVYIKGQQYDTKDKSSRTVLDKDKNIDSPYNTYKYTGLPAGPISNPGISAIKAAINPQASPYYYYLSAPGGMTIFSRTIDEHNSAIAKYLK